MDLAISEGTGRIFDPSAAFPFREKLIQHLVLSQTGMLEVFYSISAAIRCSADHCILIVEGSCCQNKIAQWMGGGGGIASSTSNV